MCITSIANTCHDHNHNLGSKTFSNLINTLYFFLLFLFLRQIFVMFVYDLHIHTYVLASYTQKSLKIVKNLYTHYDYNIIKWHNAQTNAHKQKRD